MRFRQLATKAVLETYNEAIIAQMRKHPEAYEELLDVRPEVEAVTAEEVLEKPKKKKASK